MRQNLAKHLKRKMCLATVEERGKRNKYSSYKNAGRLVGEFIYMSLLSAFTYLVIYILINILK